ncbi:hypothetical protein L7F22_033419 [Adiantum nelumboides]|nr:hypothetical protein [Adiantum nelumboides]
MSAQAHHSRPRPRPPPLIRVVHVNPPHVVHINVADFRSTVQSLTGWTNQLSNTSAQSPLLSLSPSASSSSSSCCSSPATNNSTNYQVHMPNYANDSISNHSQMLDFAANEFIDRTQKPYLYANATCITHEMQASTFIDSETDLSSPPLPKKAFPSSDMGTSPQLQYTQQSSSSPIFTPAFPCSKQISSAYAADDHDQNTEDENNDKGDDDDLYLCMMMELGDIQENDQREPTMESLSFFDDTVDDDGELLQMRLQWSLQP